MKNFLKTMLVIFGVVSVLMIAVILLLLSGDINIATIWQVINYINSHRAINIVTVVVLAVYGLCSVISVAFSSKVTSDIKGGVILPLTIGDVHISSQTFEAIVTNVAKKYKGIKTAKVNIKMKETGVSVDLFVYVLQDTIISTISSKLQEDIKETVLKQTTVAVENVNVKIKGVYTLNENKEVKEDK